MSHQATKSVDRTKKTWVRPISPPIPPNPVTSLRYDSDSDWDTQAEQEISDQESWEELPGLVPQSDDSDEDEESNITTLPYDTPRAVFKYKKVRDKVRPVAIQIPEHQKPRRTIPRDPLLNLPKLPFHPPTFSPTPKITSERMKELAVDSHEELWPEERKLLQHVLCINERSI